MANPPANDRVRDDGKSLFRLRLSIWLSGYLILVLTWGRYNAWPAALVVCLVFFPLNLALAGWLYQQNRIRFEAAPQISEWDALIGFLILAIGVASGLVLVLAVGWVGVGAVFLRPTTPETAWGEWIKLPVLFLFSFPLGLDLAGSRHHWLQYFNVAGPQRWTTVPAALPALEFQVAIWLGLYALLFWLSGAACWISLLAWPVLLLAGSQALQHLVPQRLALENAPLIAAGTLGLNFLTVTGLIVVGRRWSAAHPGPSGRWLAVADWARIRSRAPWVVALVIVLQQSPLAEGWLAGQETRFDAAGGLVWLGVLLWFRWRERGGPVHLNTRLLLAWSLFVLLAAEWTDWEPLRNLSLGLMLLGLCSWRRDWGRSLIVAALFTWLMAVPAGPSVLTHLGLSGPETAMGRSLLFCLGLVVTVALSRRRRPTVWVESLDNRGWQPVKRFGFILLCLLSAFQLASAYWRERADSGEPRIHLASGTARAATTRAITMSGIAPHARRVRVRWQGHDLDLTVGKPVDIPARLTSPELLFETSGWQIRRRRLLALPRGQVVALELSRGDQTGCALWWFENGRHVFVDYLRARRILWSGWNLTHRDLRVVLLQAPTLADPDRLVNFARGQNWFLDPAEAGAFVPRTAVRQKPNALGTELDPRRGQRELGAGAGIPGQLSN
ncbi:MAG: hypothetical protein KGS61_06550 [Verrucomicrobia bacterium]|nr:hypothetical protein [Verrucomicrobiota bacterium]